MRGLRITPNGLEDIDITTDKLQLSIKILKSDEISIRWINIGSKVKEVDAEIYGYVGDKSSKFKQFESIVIIPRMTLGENCKT